MASLAFAVAADAATADGTDAFAADAFAGLGLAAYVAAYAVAYVAVPVERRDSAAATVSDVDGGGPPNPQSLNIEEQIRQIHERYKQG